MPALCDVDGAGSRITQSSSSGPDPESCSTSPLPPQQFGADSSRSSHPERYLPPGYPTWKGKPCFHGNPEALGWCLDGIGRAIQFIGAGAFLGSTLIRIAQEAAGCETSTSNGDGFATVPECNKKVYGIKPSSLLTTYTMIVGVASACFLPLIGAIVDYTPYRLSVGRAVSCGFTLLIIPTIFLNTNNFLAVAIVQVIISFVGWIQTAITHAYLPELTSEEHVLNDYTKTFTMSSYGAMVLYLVVVIGSMQLTGNADDDLQTNQVAMSIALGVNLILLSYSWGYLFGPRDRMHPLPPGRSLWTAGFLQLYETSRYIARHYRALKWFYVSISMSDAALQALITIAITYMTDQLLLTSQENGIAIGCTLLGSVPGAVIANLVTKYTDPLKSSMATLGLLLISTALFAIVLQGPGQQIPTYVLAFVWGVGTGWKWTCDRLVASLIIPPGKDAELMGVFLFAGQCLSWLPPLIYTALNEAGISPRIGVASLEIYFLLAMACYMCMGGYLQARQEVGRLVNDANDDDAVEHQDCNDKDNVKVSLESSNFVQPQSSFDNTTVESPIETPESRPSDQAEDNFGPPTSSNGTEDR